jgi:hypothetical protein
LAAAVLFDAIPTGWVSNISQRQNKNFEDFSVTASVGVKKSQRFTLMDEA